MDDCEKLLEKAQEYKLNVVGVSFHVGSGCFSTESYLGAIKNAKKVFNMAEKFGYKMNLLDIGGGFPGNDSVYPSFIEMAKEITPLIDELFNEDIQIIAEPGRYFANGSHTLVCNIFGKREVYSKKQLELNDIKQEYLYYANDGIYNSFSCLFFDNVKIDIKPFSTKKKFDYDETFKSKIFGPTCDALDVICTNTQIPKLDVGDWFYVTEFGAYTRSCSTKFNGFTVDKSIYYIQ
jgi:ornithine decarboxylase